MPTGWYIEAVKLANEAAYDNAALPAHHPSRVFVPEFITEIKKWKPVQKRFMKVMGTETGLIRGNFPRLEGCYNVDFGRAFIYPLDVMVSLCNAYDIAPYFNLAARPLPGAVEDFATYVKDNLKPSLTVYAGCGNEYWNNSAYGRTGNSYFIGEDGKRFGGKGNGTLTMSKANRNIILNSTDNLTTLTTASEEANITIITDTRSVKIDRGGNPDKGIPAATANTGYIVNSEAEEYIEDLVDVDWWYLPGGSYDPNRGYTILATKQLKIWSDIFEAAGQRSRLVAVWETQLGGAHRFSKLTNSSYWQPFEDYIDPLTVFDAVAVNPYFGSGTFKSPGGWRDDEFTAYARSLAVADNYSAFAKALRDYMLDTPITGVPPSSRSITSYLVDQTKRWRQQTKEYGLRLIAYEGSAHIIHSVLDPSQRLTDQDIIEAYVEGFLPSADAYEVFKAWADLHVRFYDGPVMQFNFVQPIGRFGAYGLIQYFGGPTDARQELLLAEYVDRAPWWTGDYPPQAVAVPDQVWAAGVDPGFTLDDWVSNNAAVFSGTPPVGMVLDGATGALTGVPVVGSGSYTFTASNYAGSVEVVVRIHVTP
jgi:hypothetical protein